MQDETKKMYAMKRAKASAFRQVVRAIVVGLLVVVIAAVALVGYRRQELCAQATGELRATAQAVAQAPKPRPNLVEARDRAQADVQANCWNPGGNPKR